MRVQPTVLSSCVCGEPCVWLRTTDLSLGSGTVEAGVGGLQTTVQTLPMQDEGRVGRWGVGVLLHVTQTAKQKHISINGKHTEPYMYYIFQYIDAPQTRE